MKSPLTWIERKRIVEKVWIIAIQSQLVCQDLMKEYGKKSLSRSAENSFPSEMNGVKVCCPQRSKIYIKSIFLSHPPPSAGFPLCSRARVSKKVIFFLKDLLARLRQVVSWSASLF